MFTISYYDLECRGTCSSNPFNVSAGLWNYCWRLTVCCAFGFNGLIILFLAKWRSLFHPFDALALTFLFSLFVNPYLIYHVGFQLSYVVTAGIILSNPLLQK